MVFFLAARKARQLTEHIHHMKDESHPQERDRAQEPTGSTGNRRGPQTACANHLPRHRLVNKAPAFTSSHGTCNSSRLKKSVLFREKGLVLKLLTKFF